MSESGNVTSHRDFRSCSIICQALSALLLFASSAAADPVTDTHCLFGCPDGAVAGDDVVKRSIYVLSNNAETKFADWVAYSFTRNSIGPTKPRTWKVDEELDPADRIEKSDYDGANDAIGYERGHLAALADFTSLAPERWKEANILSNITPQCAAFNIGGWGALEDAERDAARATGQTIFVQVGTLYKKTMPALPNASQPHKVPSDFWKVIAIRASGKIEVAAFILSQADLPPGHCARGAGTTNRDYCEDLRSIGDIEAATGLDLFPKATASQIVDSAEGQTRLLDKLDCELQ